MNGFKQMRNEEACRPRERFLFTDELMSDEVVTKIKEACKRTDQAKVLNKSAHARFINWSRTEKEVCLFTLYAYADIMLPKQFDCIFKLDNPSVFINTKFQLTQSIYEGKYPIETIEDGHKHLCIFEFEDNVPDILNELYVGTKFYDTPSKDALTLGICQANDFAEIRSRLEYTLKLKSEYGMEWWKFDEDP
ncbi:hypothetical protein WBG78_14460 [Chryseolinea sp. T2]|uniref:hypothetical protein n=1 Tax=Chryseolinea sp. T2 TaxID=3129255 RepID=UPI0030781210